MAWQRLGNEMLDITSEINDKVKDTKTNRKNNNKARTRILKNSSDPLVSKTVWTSYDVPSGPLVWSVRMAYLAFVPAVKKMSRGPRELRRYGFNSLWGGTDPLYPCKIDWEKTKIKSHVKSVWEMYWEWSKHPCGGGNTDWSSYNVCQRKTSQSNTYSSLYP